MKARKPEPFFYFAAVDDFAIFIGGFRDEKTLVPVFMSMRIIVNNNPVMLNDPFGMVCGVNVFRAILTSGSTNQGHEWITYGGSSMGFWPNRNWQVLRPDPAANANIPNI